MSDEIFENREIPFTPSTIETVDMAMYRWLNEKLNIHTNTNQGWQKTPVIWVSTERTYQVKSDKKIRDNNGIVILPIITLERTGIEKDLGNKGIYWANLPAIKQFAGDFKGGQLEIAKQINQEKTSNYASADTKRVLGQDFFKRKNKKIVYQTISIPIPVYVNVKYTIDIKTEYQQQMNEIVQVFVTVTDGIDRIVINHDNHKYEGFVQGAFNFENNGASMGEEERLFNTKIEISVLGYLVGQGDNQNLPKVVYRENQVDVKIPRERVIVGDINDLKNKKLF